MSTVLKRIALVFSFGLLIISIRWSKDGFNFSVAGDAGGTTEAIAIGYFIAAAMTVLQFVFSTNIKNLNASLLVFGLIAYGYSIWTNYQGILSWQGASPNHIMAFILGLGMDGVPEPLMAWALGESLSGDFVGNIIKGIGSFITGKPLDEGGGGQRSPEPNTQPRPDRQNHQGGGKQRGSERRAELEKIQMRRREDMNGGQERSEKQIHRSNHFDQ